MTKKRFDHLKSNKTSYRSLRSTAILQDFRLRKSACMAPSAPLLGTWLSMKREFLKRMPEGTKERTPATSTFAVLFTTVICAEKQRERQNSRQGFKVHPPTCRLYYKQGTTAQPSFSAKAGLHSPVTKRKTHLHASDIGEARADSGRKVYRRRRGGLI